MTPTPPSLLYRSRGFAVPGNDPMRTNNSEAGTIANNQGPMNFKGYDVMTGNAPMSTIPAFTRHAEMIPGTGFRMGMGPKGR